MAERLRSDGSDYIAAAATAAVIQYLKEHPDTSKDEITAQEVVVFSQEELPDKRPTGGTPISPWKGTGWTGREDPKSWRNTTRARTTIHSTPTLALGRTRLLRG